MEKKEFDNNISILLTEKKLLEKSMEKTSEREKEEIRKRIIHINAEINVLKNKFNKGSEKK